ncbi:translation initiation factor eIF-2B subunit delta [Anopheles bellator]|uniref:translation initiation factor eIF-2B subunit delta n=1 Tax=Anopheles bellator TaxID=139047 RepID=UPI0026489149|nr:translation initiation factor eIF-2B subunit delta [Anopheles bellator]XP_058055024.1 translation initiation factor eIF-2B subunit delta [Anopheles bellator]
MEGIASTVAGTMKKKRNRSYRKAKQKVESDQQNVADALHLATYAQQTPLAVKRDCLPAVSLNQDQPKFAVDSSSIKEPKSETFKQLIRKPSRHRKRKAKGSNEDPATNDRLDSLTVEEVFPSNYFQSQTVGHNEESSRPNPDFREPPKSKKEGLAVKNTLCFAGLENIHVGSLFPRSESALSSSIIKDICVDAIFPRLTFDSGVNKISSCKQISPLQYKVQNSLKEPKIKIDIAKEGLQHVGCEELFPGNQPVKSSCHSLTREDSNAASMNALPEVSKTDKSREQILAEREAKKAVKLAVKNKSKSKGATSEQQPSERRKQLQQHETKEKKSKQSAGAVWPLAKSDTDASICEKLKELHITDATSTDKPDESEPAASYVSAACMTQDQLAEGVSQYNSPNHRPGDKDSMSLAKPPKKTLTKAERRAIQEAQRAAKLGTQQTKKLEAVLPPVVTRTQEDYAKKLSSKSGIAKSVVRKNITSVGVAPPRKHIVNLFNHLHQPKMAAAEVINSPTIHPVVTKLGVRYAGGTVAGSKARCLALLNVVKQLIHDYETPPEKEFCRSFEETLNSAVVYLQRCRPFSVSMTNALRHVKMNTRQLDAKLSDSEQKEYLLEAIEAYIRDHMEKAEEAICISVQEKIYDGDVILTYGCSSLIKHILEEANRRSKAFRVIIVNARPREEENVMLEQLVRQGVSCMCVLINAVNYVMPEVTKVLVGAHALLANGSVMSRVGTAQIALVAKSYNVPVLVCCETHKFTERVQTDAFVYNELGNPNDLVLSPRTRDLAEAKPMLTGWETISSLTILNLHYDVTPPELVTAVVTEVAILPCTSVPVILRIKPSDVAY